MIVGAYWPSSRWSLMTGSKMKIAHLLFCCCVLLIPNIGNTQSLPRETYDSMQWRMIGPHRGGRTVGATGVPGKPNEFYIGVNNGGVWKSTDYGRVWRPIFDDQPTGSIGTLAVAPSNSGRSSMLAVARASSVRTCRRETESTSRSTREKPGRIWDCATANRSATSSLIRRIRIDCSWRCSVIRMAPIRNEASSGLSTAARRFKAYCKRMKTPAPLRWNSIPGIHKRCVCQSVGGPPGTLGKCGLARATPAACSNRKMAATRGGNLRQGLPENPGRIGFDISLSNPDVMYAMCDNRVYRSERRR